MVIGPVMVGESMAESAGAVVVSSSSVFLLTSASPCGAKPEDSWMILVMKLGA